MCKMKNVSREVGHLMKEYIHNNKDMRWVRDGKM